VLVIGPNPTFLRYVGQVLPSLGETSVLMSTIADLYPGITARRDEPTAAALVKGRLDMAKVIAAAVRARQGGSRPGLEVRYERDVLRLDRRTCTRIRDRARRTRLPHNQARPVAHRLLIDALASQVADQIGYDVLGGGNLLSQEDIADIREELRESVQVRAALEEFWPRLSPEGLLADLLSSPERLASAARRLLTPEERSALLRPAGGGWTPADVPLLDEAAELLGEDHRAARARGERERRQRIAYARGVLDLAYSSRSVDLNPEEEAEILSAYDIIDAERLADRYRVRGRPDRGGAGRRRPDVGVRPHRGGRGAGALADGVADAHAALPGPVDDGGRRHGPGQRPGRGIVLAGGARAASGRPVAAGAADHQLPDAGRDRGRRG
jgi:DNA helicase IV